VINAAFKWAKRDTGVWLYDGVGDMELTAILDAYPVSMATRTYTIGKTRGIVTSRYGLQLVPYWDVAARPPIDRLLIPGGTSTDHLDASLTGVEERIAAPVIRVHDAARPRFPFEAPLEDLAREQNVPIAAFANKRLEYRAPSVQLVGRGWPVLLMLQPVLIGLVGAALVWWLTRRRDRRRQQRIQSASASPMAPAAPTDPSIGVVA
jgi:hypothetical protein